MAKFCQGCGNELSDDAVFCAKCGAKVDGSSPKEENTPAEQEKKISTKKKIMIAAGVVLLFLLACGIFGGGGSSSNSGSGTALAVKADDMLNDYIRDQGTAESKYKNKKVSITGQVIHKTQFNNSNDFMLVISTKHAAGRKYAIALDVPANKVEIVNKAEEGKFISVEGKCVGVVPQSDPTVISVQIQAEKISQ